MQRLKRDVSSQTNKSEIKDTDGSDQHGEPDEVQTLGHWPPPAGIHHCRDLGMRQPNKQAIQKVFQHGTPAIRYVQVYASKRPAAIAPAQSTREITARNLPFKGTRPTSNSGWRTIRSRIRSV